MPKHEFGQFSPVVNHSHSFTSDTLFEPATLGSLSDDLVSHAVPRILAKAPIAAALSLPAAVSEVLLGFVPRNLVMGTVDDDVLTGSDGADTIRGRGGDDTISGGDGDDKIVGGRGDDVLTGGAGSDQFVFFGPSGADTITDFTAGTGSDDLIRFSGDIFSNLADVLAHTYDDGAGNTVISKDGVDITLLGVTKDQLGANDFSFSSPLAGVGFPGFPLGKMYPDIAGAWSPILAIHAKADFGFGPAPPVS